MATAEHILDEPYTDYPVPPSLRMSEEEFVAWCESHSKARVEWVDGEVIIMSPANREHASLNLWLGCVLLPFVQRHGLGDVVGPEFTVRLAKQRRRRVPDLLFVQQSRLHLIQRNHLEGAPDAAFEIISPDSIARDWREKYAEYQTAGVREYWILDPAVPRFEAYSLNDGQFQLIAPQDGKVASVVLPGFYMRPEWVVPETRPMVLDALKELCVIAS